MNFLSLIMQFGPLLLQVFEEAHTLSTAFGAQSAAAHTQAVIDKVTPIAQMVEVEGPHLAALATGVVGMVRTAQAAAASASLAARSSSSSAPVMPAAPVATPAAAEPALAAGG